MSPLLALLLVLQAEPVARIPVLSGKPRRLVEMPELGELKGPDPRKQHIVDHGLIRDARGRWQLWACLRGVKVGRLLYRWEGASLDELPWEPKGIAARADPAFGEGVKEGVETIQAPYFLKIGELWHCFYNSGGLRYMTSADGASYARPPDNRLAAAGGRDVMVLPHEGRYYLYATVSDGARKRGYVVGSSSADLKTWSKGVVVSEGGAGGTGLVDAESPFVQRLDGYFYLFRSSSMTGKTYVYRSKDPLKFNLNDDAGLVATLPVWAPEVVFDQGRWYLTDLGTFDALLLHPLEWKAE